MTHPWRVPTLATRNWEAHQLYPVEYMTAALSKAINLFLFPGRSKYMHGYNFYKDLLVVLVEPWFTNQGGWLCGEKRELLMQQNDLL
jgi:hypothetical protein